MAGDYAEPDREIVDYQTYCLDRRIIDPATTAPLLLRGPAPPSLAGGYFACIGAAQTFGRFCAKPYPAVLQEQLGLPALNLGRGGAGPSFFLKTTDALFDYINRSRFAIVQVMSGRSAGSSLFRSDGLGFYHRIADGAPLSADDAFRTLLQTGDRAVLQRVVQETRRNWIESYRELLGRITVPTVLFWFSVRTPRYRESDGSLPELFGEFPQLVDERMMAAVRTHGGGYVECVSRRGMPQRLVSRFTGQPTTVSDPWGGSWSENTYYPSPEMHADAAEALARPCQALASSVPRRRWWTGMSLRGRRKTIATDRRG
jgi:hypothetical protein